MLHRQKHLLARWRSRGRRVEEVLAEARQHDEAEARPAQASSTSTVTLSGAPLSSVSCTSRRAASSAVSDSMSAWWIR
jgi:hypothetical protein